MAKIISKNLSWWDRWVILLNKLIEQASQEKNCTNKKVAKFYIYKTKNSGFAHKMLFWVQNKPPKVPKIWPSEACFDPKKAFYGQTLNFLYYICEICQLFGLMKFFFSSAPWGTLFSNPASFLKKLLYDPAIERKKTPFPFISIVILNWKR